jgi:hypothetical protein
MNNKGEIKSKNGQKIKNPLSSAIRGLAKISKAEKNRKNLKPIYMEFA